MNARLFFNAAASLAVAAALSTCAPAPAAPPQSSAATQAQLLGPGISVHVVRWPSCPAESGRQDCAPKPIAARIVLLRSAGQPITTVDVTEDGRFQISVPPGAYVLQADAEGMLCAPVDVAVPDHGYVQVQVRCDTGVQ